MTTECVILLHGLARTRRSFRSMAKALENSGYTTININYPSTRFNIETLSVKYLNIALKQALTHSPDKIHFVTHSMGGILLRYYLKHHDIDRLGRIVMLSPPNRGSEIVDKLSNWKLFQLINGPAGHQLSTAADSMPNLLGPTVYEVGIITGDRSYNPLLSNLLTGANDGKVTVESAKLGGMSDFIVVPKSHSFIMNSGRVKQLVINFLKTGHFLP